MSARSCYPGAWREVDRLIRLWRSCEAVSARRKNEEPRNENPELCAGAGQVRKWILVCIRMNHITAVCQHNRLAKQSKIRGLHVNQTCDLFWKLYNWRKAAVSNTCHLKTHVWHIKHWRISSIRLKSFYYLELGLMFYYHVYYKIILLFVTLLFDN